MGEKQESVEYTLNWKGDSFFSPGSPQANLRDACIKRVNWGSLCAYVSALNDGCSCTLLPENTMGGRHLVWLLSINDGGGGDARWIARIQLEPSTQTTIQCLRNEIDAMELVRTKGQIPVPRVFGFELDDYNAVGAAFVLMEFLPGSTAMDVGGGWDVHHGQISPMHRQGFYEAVARIQVHMTSIRMPLIGSIVRSRDGHFDVGPIPGLGGPFATASDFFKAWARKTKFPFSEKTIRDMMDGGPVDAVLASINEFPSRLEALADRISFHDKGPFPLYHPDLYHSNIVVDHDFKVLGVIDWEGASTVPWELVEFPLFLGSVPPKMNPPENYGPDGQPIDGDLRELWRERDRYIEYVKQTEQRLNLDNMLSQTLASQEAQGLAHAVRVYPDGKLGYYCRLLPDCGR